MVYGDVLRQLFRSFAAEDDSEFRVAAEAIIREERAKNHRLLADDLERLLARRPSARNGSSGLRKVESAIPTDRERGFPLIDMAEPELEWSALVAPASTLAPIQRIAEEHVRSDVLTAAGLQPSTRCLFYGPPGCGKTLAAHVVASALARPLITVRFDAVVSSLLGETAANLRRVFDFIRQGRWVVLFDEFDAIGKDRDNALEHGELKRVVNSLLQLMDAYRGDSLLIAATNHENLLDSALWRRFDAVVNFPIPDHESRVLLLRSFLRGFAHRDLNLATLAKATNGATGADIERIALDAAKRAVLDGRTTLLSQDLAPAIAAFRERLLVAQTEGSTRHSRSRARGSKKAR